MRIAVHPTGLALVGCLLICASSVPALAELQSTGQQSGNSKDIHVDVFSNQDDNWGILETEDEAFYFPWYGRLSMTMPMAQSSPAPSSQPSSETIQLSSSNSSAKVDDLTAVNEEKQRDLYYNASDPQRGDERYGGLVNTQEISISGEEDPEPANELLNADPFETQQEDFLELNGENETEDLEFSHNEINHAGNYLNVDVSDITVSAINTMEGGSAVATSNIIIEPVQIIVCPSEVNAKLK